MPRQGVLTILLLSLFALSVTAQRTKYPTKPFPTFEDYLVIGSQTPAVKIIGMDRGEFKESLVHFRQRIRDAAKSGPNFAGHYSIVGCSCGLVSLTLTADHV